MPRTGFETIEHFFQKGGFDLIFFIARLDHAERLIVTFLNRFDVGENEFEVDDADIAHGVDRLLHVGDVFVFETAHHMHDRVYLADMGKKFIAETFPFGSSLHKPRDVHEFDGGGSDLFAVVKRGEFRQSLVGNGDHADVRFYGTERKIRHLRARMGDGVEKSRFADVRQAHYS